MSSIRPLATITLLAAMGVFLYLKINEPPESASSEAPAEWEGAPKFEFGDAAPTGAPVADTAAPPFTPAPAAVAPSAESAAPAYSPPSPAATAESPAAPPIAAPPLPDLPSTTAPPTESAPSSESLAASIGDLPPGAASPNTETSSAPAPVVETSEATTTSSVADAAPPATASTGLPPIPELPPLPEAATTNEPPSAAAPAPPELAESAATTPPVTPRESPFDAARPAIHAALSQGEFARALQLVSKWYNDPALLPEETEEVQTLLNQLAGTVVYSNEHHLEPAYTVQAGDTLETIATKYQVPWQLLAKVNGVATATGIQPGQTLKVIRGPFMGVVDVSDAELTLSLDGRFAGKFPVQLDGAAASEGEWTVEQKQLDPSYSGSSADRKLVLRSGDNPNASVVIASTSTALAGPTPPQGAIRIPPEQTEDLYDILSIGSRLVIRR